MIYTQSTYLSLPRKAGVYNFIDESNNVIYIGKANDLKARVSSYFVNKDLGDKTRVMVSQITRIKITIVESELEALLLEAFYIKKFKPKYNILQKDNKSFITIKITIKDKYPSITLVRHEQDSKAIYFGPYPSASSVRLVLKTVRRIFPYISVRNHPKKICLYNHIGLCPCPSVYNSPEVSKQYKKNVRNIIRILEGQSQKIMRELEKARDKLSKNEDFEDAEKIQIKIDALSIITTPFHQPFEYDLNPNLRIDLRQKELNGLMKILNDSNKITPLFTRLERIECYDISNTQGTNSTASMVVMTKGEIDKSQYRKFKLRTRGPNDFAMIEEVLKRRLRHNEWTSPDLIIVDGGRGQISSAIKILHENNLQIPVIGLAKREETIIVPELTNSNINCSDLKFSEISLPKNSPPLLLIMRIRDEAHRFAITYHKKLRSKMFLYNN